MKILFVLTYYRPHWTGLTQYAARLAEGLSKSGNSVQVLCSRHKKDLPKYEKINNVLVYRLPYLFKFLRTVVMPTFPLTLWKKIKENDKIIAYLPLQEVFLVALFCRLQGKKLFLVHNGDLVLPNECGFFCRMIEKIYYFTTSYAIKNCQKIIVQTQDYSQSSNLLRRFKDKWKIILPLYNIPQISDKDTDNFKEEYSLKNKILIGYSGRFVEEKGIDYLLQTIPVVIEKIPNAHFVFAGDYKINYENFWDKIKVLIEKNKKNITLLGLINDQLKIFSFYKSLSVYVQPSRTDCFPSSQIEALLSGIPSVCTDIPGARWAVKQSEMGEIVRVEDVNDLAEGIVKVIKERKKYIAKINKVKQIFDYNKTLLDYERLFKED